MDEPAIVRERLHRQRLAGPPFGGVAEAVRWFGAVQGQEWAEVKWSLSMRAGDCTDQDVEAALARGEIVRTHLLRPTWHLVAPDDLRWLTRLTGPRVHARNARRYAELGLDAGTLARGAAIMADALDGAAEPLTRRELAAALEAAGIATDGQRIAHMVMYAELELVLCSGPRRGKQHTYTLVDRTVPAAPGDDFDEPAALAELARRYFASHGPATLRDFAWWSGLAAADARLAVELAGDDVAVLWRDGRREWLGAAEPVEGDAAPTGTLLIPTYDEVLVAYRDLRVVFAVEEEPFEMAFRRPILVDGRVAGVWERTLRPREVVVSATIAGPAEVDGLKAAAERFGRFAGLPARVEARSWGTFP